MPTIDANLGAWDREWDHDGSDWSHAWGSTASMWRCTLLPRIGRFLPCESMLEIAPGRGRVTELLLPHCRHFVGVDLAAACVDHCRRRFAAEPHARFVTTDGRHLPEVADDSIDFAFSWDSLVHADLDVMTAYLDELARTLRPGGFAFLHHSNMAHFVDENTHQPTIENPHWRDPTVSAEKLRRACSPTRIRCRTQELVQWGGPQPTDCFTLLQRPADPQTPTEEPTLFQHPDLNAEMAWARALNQGYWQV